MAAPERPERRVPGYVLVVLLVAVGAVAAVPVFFLHPESHPGPSLLLVRATDNITATPANASVDANFGPHCSQFTWDATRHFLAVQADADLAGAEGLLLNHYVEQGRNFVSNTGDYERPFMLNGSAWQILSPIDGRVLATFTRTVENVTVNGTTYGPGASWSLRFEYDATTPQGTVHVSEAIVFQNEGVVPSRIVPVAPCA